MRKFAFFLPACAVLLAAAVLTSELGAALAESSPAATAAAYDEEYVGDDGDITATSWIETGKKHVDTRKGRLPPPPKNPSVKKKPKK
jgi:hypothetical protein